MLASNIDINKAIAMEIIEQVITWVAILAIIGIAMYFIIKKTCKYQAKQNAEAFDYDYLAERTAEEICKRILIIERQKAEVKEVKEDPEDPGA